mmetsp:Transcript_4778/g.11898  ORF Transcript_4778/g.11898 Transcript_4778/m.11898 type:complete len:366 (-) Transcript_4778:1648-2745(-)
MNIRMEEANSIRATTHTGNTCIWKLASLCQHLCFALLADHTLKIANNRREGMRSNRRTHQIVGGTHILTPISHRLIDCILECTRSTLDSDHGGAKIPHTEHVECLTTTIVAAHVHSTLQTEQSTGRSCGDAMLTGASFSNNARLAKALGQQTLRDTVVDLVCTGVRQILALQPDARTTDVFTETLGKVGGRLAADVGGAKMAPLCLEGRVALRHPVGALQLLQCLHQSFGGVAPAELPEAVREGRHAARRSDARFGLLGGRCIHVGVSVVDCVGGLGKVKWPSGAVATLRQTHKGTNLLEILHAVGLHTAAHVHGERLHVTHRLRHVVTGEAAGQQQRHVLLKIARDRPVKGSARAAAQRLITGV